MPERNPIRWIDGSGWLILAGRAAGPNDAGALDVEAQALTRIARGEPIAYIWAAGDIDRADAHLAALEDLGAPTGFLLDVLTEDDEAIARQMEEVGMIILGDGHEPERLRSALIGAAGDAIQNAFSRDCVIYAIGAGARVLGSLIGEKRGLGFVDGALIVAEGDSDDGSQTSAMRAYVQANPDSYGVGLGRNSALALGPEGQIEVWGEGRVTIAVSHPNRQERAR